MIILSDCYQDERFDQSIDGKTGFRSKQMICVPLTSSGGQPIGAVQVINSHNGADFTTDDINLLSAFRGFIQISVMSRQQHLTGLTGIMVRAPAPATAHLTQVECS